MNCPTCKNYFPDDESSCPYCGCVVSKAEKKADRKKRQEAAAGRKAAWGAYNALDHRVESVVLLTTDKVTETRKGALGTAARTLVGGALFGTFGAAVGLVSGRAETRTVKTTATFLVKYASGLTATETVDIESRRFRELSRYIV